MRTMQEVDVGASQMDGAGNDGNNKNNKNNLAIKQLAEIQAAQTIDDNTAAGQDDFGSG
jgi:hypothetical protein